MLFHLLIINFQNRPNSSIIAELHARVKRARGRSPIAKVIYPSQKIW